MTLAELQEQYELIMHSLTGSYRDGALAQLMDRMEQEYRIPVVQNPEWERNNRAIMAMYRKLSVTRTTWYGVT